MNESQKGQSNVNMANKSSEHRGTTDCFDDNFVPFAEQSSTSNESNGSETISSNLELESKSYLALLGENIDHRISFSLILINKTNTNNVK